MATLTSGIDMGRYRDIGVTSRIRDDIAHRFDRLTFCKSLCIDELHLPAR
jgi:hypothetical protein